MPVIDPPAPGLLRTLTDVTGYDAAPDGSAPVKSGSMSVMTPIATAAALTAEQSARSAADTTLTTALAHTIKDNVTGTQTLAGPVHLPGLVADATVQASVFYAPGNASLIGLGGDNYLGGSTYFRSTTGNTSLTIDGATGNFSTTGTMTATSGTFSGPVGLGVYTVGTLPTPGTGGRVVGCTNARNAGEVGGAGTGSLVYDNGAAWRIPGQSTAVAA